MEVDLNCDDEEQAKEWYVRLTNAANGGDVLNS